jgi:hypothetical protein
LEQGKADEFDSALAEALPGPAPITWEDAQARLKNLPMASKRALLKKLDERFGMNALPRPSLMNWEQVREMREYGISFGSHTVSHAILPVEPENDREKELRVSRNTLRDQVPGCEEWLAYPSGRFDARVMTDCEAAGYAAAFTTKPGYADAGTKRMSIPRVNIDNAVINDHRDVFSSARARLHILRRGRIGLGPEGDAY